MGINVQDKRESLGLCFKHELPRISHEFFINTTYRNQAEEKNSWKINGQLVGINVQDKREAQIAGSMF